MLKGLNVSGLAPRGSIIVLSANTADDPANSGIWRSTDTGSTWSHVSGSGASGLPAGDCFDLAWDPIKTDRLYTANPSGVYRSDNAGAIWLKVSDSAMDAVIGLTNNMRIAVGRSDNVYVAIVNDGTLAGLYRSGNGRANDVRCRRGRSSTSRKRWRNPASLATASILAVREAFILPSRGRPRPQPRLRRR